MSLDAIIVIILLLLTVVLFVSEYLSVDIVALLAMAALMATGVLTPAEGLSGFSHEATVTIGAMFVLSEGVRRTGALDLLSDFFLNTVQQSYWRSILLMMPMIGIISAFINNTAAVAIFIPVMLRVADEIKVSPTCLLMPLSFAAMLGGVCTLIGTSTNILVSTLAVDHGFRPFGMFEFAPLGLIIFAAGCAYMIFLGIRLIPDRRGRAELTKNFEMAGYLTDLVIKPEFEHIGQSVIEMIKEWKFDLEVLLVFRGSKTLRAENPEIELREGDVLRVRGSGAEIEKLLDREDLVVQTVERWSNEERSPKDYALLEVVVAPDSFLDGRTISNVHFVTRYGARVLAARKRGQLLRERLGRFRLSGGDSLLLAAERERIGEILEDRSFVMVSEAGLTRFRRSRMPVALGILGGVVAVAAFNIIPVSVAAVCGVLLLVLTGCLTAQEIYEAIHWRIIFLLGGVIPLGLALEKTGLAGRLAQGMIDVAMPFGPIGVVAGFFLVAMLLTSLISNQATAALLAPIAIQAAATQGLQPRPLLLAITFAASLSFMTPIGYQTNTLIYGPGQYRFTDFTKVGTPLNLLLWIIGTLLIPVFWPL